MREEVLRARNPKLAAIDQLKEDIENYKFHMKLKDLNDVSKKTNQEIIKTLSDRIKVNKKLLGL